MIVALTRRSLKKRISGIPNEDSYNFDQRGVLAVADGITRDTCEILPNTANLLGQMRFAWNYCPDSPAKIAADLFTTRFVQNLGEFILEHERNEEYVRVAFEKANKAIADWNKANMPNPDYLTRDLAGCVAAGATVSREEKLLHYGFIGDCGVAVFDRRGDLKLQTEDRGPNKYGPLMARDEVRKRFKWRDPECRIITRRDYRNGDPEKSYGALTGEDSAMPHVITGELGLDKGDRVVLFTDGLVDVLGKGEFSDILRKRDFAKLKRLCERTVKSEGTLVIDC